MPVWDGRTRPAERSEAHCHNDSQLATRPLQSPTFHFPLSFPRSSATMILLSRFSHLVLPSPVNPAPAAMCVQPDALGRKAIQYIVLYCLTPPRFHRYSSSNLCTPNPARDGIDRSDHHFGARSIDMVNRPEIIITNNWPLATALPRSSRCLN